MMKRSSTSLLEDERFLPSVYPCRIHWTYIVKHDMYPGSYINHLSHVCPGKFHSLNPMYCIL